MSIHQGAKWSAKYPFRLHLSSFLDSAVATTIHTSLSFILLFRLFLISVLRDFVLVAVKGYGIGKVKRRYGESVGLLRSPLVNARSKS